MRTQLVCCVCESRYQSLNDMRISCPECSHIAFEVHRPQQWCEFCTIQHGSVDQVRGTALEAQGNYDQSGCGGKRFSEGKTEWHLFPMETIEPAVKVMMMGKKKYGEGNWEKGMSYSTVYNCLMRHVQAWFKGEDTDPESGENHLAHAMCNVMMLLWYQLKGKGKDDRPSK